MSDPLSPKQLSQAVLNLGKGDCTPATLHEALAIIGRNGESARNVYAAVPLLAQEVRAIRKEGKRSAIDLNANGDVELPELTSAMIGAARVAVKYGITLESLKESHLNEIGREAKTVCNILQRNNKSHCGR
jgi:hypothetical protein